MNLYVITDCDAVQADRAGRQMSRVGLDAIFYTGSERGKVTADTLLKYQSADCRCEILESLCDLDGEKAAALMGEPMEALLGMRKVAFVIPAESFGRHLGPRLMHVSDKSIGEGVHFAPTEGTISMFNVKKGETIETTGYFVNASLHLKVSDLEIIKDLPLSEE